MKTLRKIFGPYKGLPKGIYILFVAKVINSVGNFVFPLISLILTEKIGLSKTGAGTFITVAAISQVPSLLLGGKLSDSWGRKKTIVFFQGLGIIGYIICGFLKPSIIVAILIVAAADSYAIASPSLDALNADITTPKNRKGAYSLLYMGSNIGFATATAVGGMLYKNYLWLIFIGDALTTLLSTILILLFVKEPEKNKQVQNENKLEASEEGSVFKILIKRPVLLYFAIIMFIYQFSYSQWGFTLPLQMADIFKGNGARLYGLVASSNGLEVIIFTPLITALMRKIKPLNSIFVGGIFYMVAYGSMGYIKSLYMFFIAVFIMTLGEVMISTNNGTFIANHTPSSHRGRINSILPIITGSGYVVGPMIMGRVADSFGYTVVWTIVSAGMLIGVVCMKMLERIDK